MRTLDTDWTSNHQHAVLRCQNLLSKKFFGQRARYSLVFGILVHSFWIGCHPVGIIYCVNVRGLDACNAVTSMLDL